MKTNTFKSSASARMVETGREESRSATDRKISMAKGLGGVIAKQPFFKGLTPPQIELLADAAMVEEFDAGETIMAEGDPANRFYLILSGKVLLESETEGYGRIPIQTLGPGDDLGWSWLFPPYYIMFNARAVEPTMVIFFYGTRLRARCEENPVFGFELMKRVASAMLECLNLTRQELLKQAGKKT